MALSLTPRNLCVASWKSNKSKKDHVTDKRTPQHGVTMNTPLTTFDGYPRPDLDIAQIRTTRARIIRLKNDYKELMERIDVALQAHWANPTAPAVAGDEKGLLTMERQGQEETASAVSSSSSSSSVGIPFAKVNTVTAGSPASEAGLRVGDRILRFGDVDWRNHEKLSRVAATVQGSEGRVIVVEVVRPSEVGGGQESVSVRVTPRQNWGGRGMLGCLLLPV